MIKRSIVGFLLCLIPSLVFAAEIKVGYVDLNKVFNDSQPGIEAKKEFKEKLEKIRKILDEKQDKLKKLKEDLEKKGAMLNEKAREEKENEYKEKLKEYQKQASEFEDELRQKNIEVTNQMLSELRELISKMAKEEGYAVIIEKNEGGVIYLSPSIDITDEVIKRYNDMKLKEAEQKKTSEKGK